jgi:hypothetical protein
MARLIELSACIALLTLSGCRSVVGPRVAPVEVRASATPTAAGKIRWVRAWTYAGTLRVEAQVYGPVTAEWWWEIGVDLDEQGSTSHDRYLVNGMNARQLEPLGVYPVDDLYTMLGRCKAKIYRTGFVSVAIPMSLMEPDDGRVSVSFHSVLPSLNQLYDVDDRKSVKTRPRGSERPVNPE